MGGRENNTLEEQNVINSNFIREASGQYLEGIHTEVVKELKRKERRVRKDRKMLDRLNEQVRQGFADSHECRTKRDSYNKEVQELKEKRNILNDEILNFEEYTIDAKTKTELQNMRKKTHKYHKKIKDIAAKSQEIHQQMLLAVKNAKSIRVIADQTHDEVRELNIEIKKLRVFYKSMNDFRRLRINVNIDHL